MGLDFGQTADVSPDGSIPVGKQAVTCLLKVGTSRYTHMFLHPISKHALLHDQQRSLTDFNLTSYRGAFAKGSGDCIIPFRSGFAAATQLPTYQALGRGLGLLTNPKPAHSRIQLLKNPLTSFLRRYLICHELSRSFLISSLVRTLFSPASELLATLANARTHRCIAASHITTSLLDRSHPACPRTL